MNPLEVITITIVSGWLLVLSVATLVVIRQSAILTVRLNRVKGNFTEKIGLDLGVAAPASVATLVPEVTRPRGYVVLTSSSCTACHELVPGLQALRIEPNVVALVPGSSHAAVQLAEQFPPWIRVIRDPEASAIAQALEVDRTPYGMEFQQGKMSAKVYLHKPADLAELFESGKRAETRRGMTQLEVAGRGN